jgi:hypothetical protein
LRSTGFWYTGNVGTASLMSGLRFSKVRFLDDQLEPHFAGAGVIV